MSSENPVPRSIFLAPDEALLSDLSVEAIKDALTRDGGLLWVALSSEHPETGRVLTEVFGFHALAVDDCLDGRLNTPKIDDYGEWLFVVSQSVDASGAPARLALEELDLFLGKNFVVTVKAEGVLPSVDRLFTEASENAFLLNRGSDFLAHTILDVVVDELLPAVEAMDERLDDIEQQIIERPSKLLLSEVLLLKREVLQLRRSILAQRDMVNRLSRGEFGTLIQQDALIFYRDIYDHMVRAEAMLDGLRDLADGALSSYLSAVNNRMNEIMKAMSVVAVIFLPLTLIASIFGTNLDYAPVGVTLDGGFYWMLGLMVAMAAAMIVYFRRRGWF